MYHRGDIILYMSQGVDAEDIPRNGITVGVVYDDNNGNWRDVIPYYELQKNDWDKVPSSNLVRVPLHTIFGFDEILHQYHIIQACIEVSANE